MNPMGDAENHTGLMGAEAAGIPFGQLMQTAPLLVNRAKENRAITTRTMLANMLADAEGTDKFSDPYGVGFGGARIDTSKPHPGVVGRYKNSPTSAAGKYQFTLDTWKDAHGGKNVPMTAANQEKALDYLLQHRAKITPEQLEAGDIGGMMPKLGKIWASLPTSTSGQPKRSVAYIADSLRKMGAPNDLIKSLDSLVTGQPHTASPIGVNEVTHATAPRHSEVAADKAMHDQMAQDSVAQEQQMASDQRNQDIDKMITAALSNTSKMVDAPDGLPTKYDEHLLKIIKAA